MNTWSSASMPGPSTGDRADGELAGATVRLTTSPSAMPDTMIAATMSPASTSAAGRVSEAEHEQHAPDDLDHADRVDEGVGCRQAVVLEGRHLGGVLGELAHPEDDEDAAADHARDQRRDALGPRIGPATSRSATAAIAAQYLPLALSSS